MKYFLPFALLILFSKQMKAQDTLVSKTGLIIPAYIVETDTKFISYKGIDSLINEVIMIESNKLLMIKHKDGKVDRFYSNDTLITMKGEVVLTKVLEMDQDFITCFYYNGKITEPTIVLASSIFMVKLQDGTNEVIEQTKTKHVETKQVESTPINYYELGVNDGNKYFKTSTGAIVGEVISGLGTWLVIGIIPGAAIGFSKPANLHSLTNPNDALLNKNKDYQEGYMNAAKSKKSKACGKAYASGLAIPLGILVGAIAFYGFY